MPFNILGIIVWFPLPPMRRIVVNAAKMLGGQTGQMGIETCASDIFFMVKDLVNVVNPIITIPNRVLLLGLLHSVVFKGNFHARPIWMVSNQEFLGQLRSQQRPQTLTSRELIFPVTIATMTTAKHLVLRHRGTLKTLIQWVSLALKSSGMGPVHHSTSHPEL